MCFALADAALAGNPHLIPTSSSLILNSSSPLLSALLDHQEEVHAQLYAHKQSTAAA
jgi:DNA-binding GntR family transcriptional regulator